MLSEESYEHELRYGWTARAKRRETIWKVGVLLTDALGKRTRIRYVELEGNGRYR